MPFASKPKPKPKPNPKPSSKPNSQKQNRRRERFTSYDQRSDMSPAQFSDTDEMIFKLYVSSLSVVGLYMLYKLLA